MRYYQGIIDMHTISKGSKYKELKKSFVIFICTFDPFGENRYIYTFENTCRENKNLTLNDETLKVIVNVYGTVGNISSELKAVLDYIAKGIANTDYTKNLDNAVEKVRNDEEWRAEYMTLYMRDVENQQLGDYKRIVSSIRKKKDTLSSDFFIDMFDISDNEYNKIIYFINNKPDMDDEDIADKILNDEKE